MAKIIVNDQEKEIPDGEPIKDACEELGIPFGCRQGNCGTCTSEILEGMENLGEKNEKENNMELQENQRLACQCKIKQGVVKLKSTLY